MSLVVRLAAGVLSLGLSLSAGAAEVDWRKIDALIGRAGSSEPGDVHKYTLPRDDLRVTVDDVEVRPALALSSWLAFRPMDFDTMVMGDLVLTEEELSPVMELLGAEGIEITAIHNHLLRAKPPVMYVHIHGLGDAAELAIALRDALGRSRTPVVAEAPAGSGAAAPALDLDTDLIDRATGAKGKASGGVYHVSLPRAEPIEQLGIEIPPAMGTATAINVQPTGPGKAAAAGDLVLTADEIPTVLSTLLANQIEVTALHNHMLDEQPRLFFMHFWAHDEVDKIARGLEEALDQMNLQRENTKLQRK